MDKWILKEHIQIVDKEIDWQDAIRLCGNPLLKSKIINNNYIEKIIKTHNQIGPYYVLAPHITVPHARPEDGSFDTALSLLIIKNGIQFGKVEYDPVKIIIMLASKNTKILVSMPQKLSDEVTEFAKELNQNKSALINQALEFYFDHLDLQIAKKRSLEKNETISLSEIRKLSDEQI